MIAKQRLGLKWFQVIIVISLNLYSLMVGQVRPRDLGHTRPLSDIALVVLVKGKIYYRVPSHALARQAGIYFKGDSWSARWAKQKAIFGRLGN